MQNEYKMNMQMLIVMIFFFKWTQINLIPFEMQGHAIKNAM